MGHTLGMVWCAGDIAGADALQEQQCALIAGRCGCAANLAEESLRQAPLPPLPQRTHQAAARDHIRLHPMLLHVLEDLHPGADISAQARARRGERAHEGWEQVSIDALGRA